MIINIEDEEEHNSEYHTDVSCIYCARKFPKSDISFHQDSCLERPAECRFCTLQLTVREKGEHEYICGAKTEKCDKCNRYIPIKDYDVHHCEEEIYLNKHIDVSNIPVVNKKAKKVINPGEIANMNRVGILHNKIESPVKNVKENVRQPVHPPIVHHKREVVVNKGPSVKVEIGKKVNSVKDVDKNRKEVIDKIEVNYKKPTLANKIRNDTYDKNKNEKIFKELIKPNDKKDTKFENKESKFTKKDIKPGTKVDDILKSGLNHKENTAPKSVKPKPMTPHKPIDLNKKITSSPGKLNKEPIIKKMPYKKEIPEYKPKNKTEM